jgi:hypothetical protein
MDRIGQYRQYIEEILTPYTQYPSIDDIEVQLIIDREKDHYQLFHLGWRGSTRIYGCAIHLQIKEGKIWIEHNSTEIQVAQELVDRGVPKQDIVLGMHSPFMRQFTDYA